MLNPLWLSWTLVLVLPSVGVAAPSSCSTVEGFQIDCSKLDDVSSLQVSFLQVKAALNSDGDSPSVPVPAPIQLPVLMPPVVPPRAGPRVTPPAFVTRVDSEGQSVVSNTDTASNSSLCESGKLLPEFWLIGAQKSATTSLSHELMEAGIRTPCGKKECHFFESPVPFHVVYPRRNITSVAQKQQWLEMLPQCPSGSKQVIGDFTPVLGGGRHIPSLMGELYGSRKQAITITVNLREPVSRSESMWYEGQNPMSGTCPGCRDAESFEASVRAGMQSQNPESHYIFTSSLYAKNLEYWLRIFSPKQFVVVPFQFYTNAGGGETCLEIARRMEVKLDCPVGSVAAHSNDSEDLANGISDLHDVNLQTQVRTFMEAHNTKLYALLADAQAHGATLMNYTGTVGDVSGVKAWLEASW